MPNDPASVRGVFVGYRREDTSGYAGRLVDSLKSRLPNLPIFMDIDSIQPGQDFSDIIEANSDGWDITEPSPCD